MDKHKIGHLIRPQRGYFFIFIDPLVKGEMAWQHRDKLAQKVVHALNIF
jgi:hypothetical protein